LYFISVATFSTDEKRAGMITKSALFKEILICSDLPANVYEI